MRKNQPHLRPRAVLVAGIGGTLAIGLLGIASQYVPISLLVPSFGASCALLFALPGAPLSRPLNVIAGHVVSAFAGVALGAILPITWWSIALAVGVAIAAMAGLQILHPPAAGNPIVVMTSAASWPFLVVPILIGAIALVLIAAAFHRATGVAYPLRASSAAAVT